LNEIPLQTLLVALFVLLLLSGFFSIAETRMMALNRYRLRHLVSTGNRGAIMASALLDRTWFRNVRQGFTGSLLKHSGLQTNWEAGLAYTLATPNLKLGPVATHLKVGAGFSYAFSRPSYEDGPLAEPDRRYRGQFLLLVENHWRLADSDKWSLVLRVHHRSGVYGLIAPQNVGSNFLAVGVERRL
jgi:hypothetical protein